MLWDPIPRLWPGEVAVCIASGPTLAEEDLRTVRASRARCVVVNRMWAAAPWADLLYAADGRWWKSGEAPSAEEFLGVRVSAAKSAEGTIKVNVRNCTTVSDRWLCSGTNSGLQALCLAAAFGARRIGLLGYSMGAGVGLHSHPDHVGMSNPDAEAFARWTAAFDLVAPQLHAAGIEVVNCSESKLRCFPRRTIADFLSENPL